MCLKLRMKGILLIKPNYKYSHLLNLNIQAIREREKKLKRQAVGWTDLKINWFAKARFCTN